MDELKTDMLELAKHVYELSKKHGGIYIQTAHADNADLSFTTYRVGEEFRNEWYFTDEKDK